MTIGTINNGKNVPLNVRTGTIPDLSGVLEDWFQPMTFYQVVKTISGFQVVENSVPLDFFGVIQPLTPRRLLFKPEGQRAWTWLQLHADTSLRLDVDDVINYLGVQTRVMAKSDNAIYGYIEYELVQDWEGSGPKTEYNGGNAINPGLNPNLEGGQSDSSGLGDVSGGDAGGN